MFLASIVALVALEPAAATPTTDQPAAPIAPAAESAVPPISATQSPAPTAPLIPPPALAAPLTAPPSDETVEETEPARPPAPPPIHPTASFGFEFGYASGGDRFLTVSSPTLATRASANAGDGMFFALAANWTPYWTESGVGLGVYARAGAKYVAVENDTTSMSFLRCPLAVGAQVLLPIVGRWFALGRLGVLTEVLGYLSIASDGVFRSSTGVSSGLGEFIDAGAYWAASETAGVAVIARYERLDVSYSGDTMRANNRGALAAAYLRF